MKEVQILSENEYLKIPDSNFSKATFKFDQNTKAKNTILSEKVSSISFISFESEDECQKGIEFISSKRDIAKLQKSPYRCFYLPPSNTAPAILYTSKHSYESSLMKRSQAMDFSQAHIRKIFLLKQKLNEQNKVDLKSLAKLKSKMQEKNHFLFYKKKNTRSIINALQSRTYLTSQNLLNNTKTISSANIPIKSVAIIFTFIVLLCAITFLITLCTGKQSVEASTDSINPYQNSSYQNQNNFSTAQNTIYQAQTFTPTAQNSPYPINAVQSDLNYLKNGVYMDQNIVYAGVVPYQGAMPFDRRMREDAVDGIKNAQFNPY